MFDFDRQSVEEQIKHISSQIPVFFTSIHQLETIVRLRKSISEGETVVFVGSSGVGKSSLVNALCEKPVLLTSDISLSTGKGRHTSTRFVDMLAIFETARFCIVRDFKYFGQ